MYRRSNNPSRAPANSQSQRSHNGIADNFQLFLIALVCLRFVQHCRMNSFFVFVLDQNAKRVKSASGILLVILITNNDNVCVCVFFPPNFFAFMVQ